MKPINASLIQRTQCCFPLNRQRTEVLQERAHSFSSCYTWLLFCPDHCKTEVQLWCERGQWASQCAQTARGPTPGKNRLSQGQDSESHSLRQASLASKGKVSQNLPYSTMISQITINKIISLNAPTPSSYIWVWWFASYFPLLFLTLIICLHCLGNGIESNTFRSASPHGFSNQIYITQHFTAAENNSLWK